MYLDRGRQRLRAAHRVLVGALLADAAWDREAEHGGHAPAGFSDHDLDGLTACTVSLMGGAR